MTQYMLLTREETFSPICALYQFDTEDEVVKYANDTSMGLASYFFTKSVDGTWKLLENLEAGIIGMNTGECYSIHQTRLFSPIADRIQLTGNRRWQESTQPTPTPPHLTKAGTLTLD
jgi:acyl-CoA reductase-like NAD-dependent aldehyde dehydrogenase